MLAVQLRQSEHFLDQRRAILRPYAERIAGLVTQPRLAETEREQAGFLAGAFAVELQVDQQLGTQRASVALELIFPRQLVSADLITRYDQWLATSSANPAAKRYVTEGRADVARALAAQQRDARG